MIIRYLDFLERLEYELIQKRDEGIDVSASQGAFNHLKEQSKSNSLEMVQAKAKETLDFLAGIDVPHHMKVNEPNSIEAIHALLHADTSDETAEVAMDSKELLDRIQGAWLGRAGGCLLGKPIEKYHRTVIREMLESNQEWPLNNYFTQQNMPADLLEKYPWKRRWGLESLRENIVCMPEDDDLNFTMLNLHILESFGPEFSSENVGTTWLTKLPVFEVFTAERIAYQNLLNGISPPESASHLNPFREWIGAQIRADLWGYVCPGEPRKAAEFAWRDARVTHVRTGIYGEMFFAAVIAAAFVEQHIRAMILAGLSQIPPESRFALAIKKVLDLNIEAMEWEAVVDQLYAWFGHYHWVHTINNAALTVAALIHGNGDYEKTITNAVMGGWDTDCNGATSGSIVGVMLGAKELPEKWIAPLQDRVRSSLGGYDNSSFTDLAQRTLNVSLSMRSTNNLTNINKSDDF